MIDHRALPVELLLRGYTFDGSTTMLSKHSTPECSRMARGNPTRDAGKKQTSVNVCSCELFGSACPTADSTAPAKLELNSEVHGEFLSHET
jgi:hypothetical protein